MHIYTYIGHKRFPSRYQSNTHATDGNSQAERLQPGVCRRARATDGSRNGEAVLHTCFFCGPYDVCLQIPRNMLRLTHVISVCIGRIWRRDYHPSPCAGDARATPADVH
jgi:hypothetical protein